LSKFSCLKKIGYDPYLNSDGYYYDEESAQRAIDFFKNELRFTKGKYKGKPFIPGPWQDDFIRCIFGWRRKSDGLRRYRDVFLYVPRKAGKSQLISGVALYCFFCDGENDAEVYIGARDREQAKTLYKMCKSMVVQNETLKDDVTIYATSNEIKASWDDSIVKAISGDALSQHSLSPSVGIIDELHAQRNGDLVEAIETGMGEREQPLFVKITTADIDRTSLCNDELDLAKSIRDGKIINARYLPVIYETDKKENWRDPKVWKRVNPTFPITPTEDYMKSQAAKAEYSLSALASFKRLHLNMKTSSLEGWINMDYWRIGSEKFKEDELRGQECYAAFDLGSKIDLCAVVLFFPDIMKLVCRFYCPKTAIENDKTGHYQEWCELGELKESGEERTDYRHIHNDLLAFDKEFVVKKVAFDPHNANILVGQMEEEGFEERLVEFTQTYRNFTDPAKEFESLILDKKLKHNSRVLDWMAANVTIREGPSGDVMPQKPKRNSPLKIDGIPAAIMAVGLWMRDRDENDIAKGQLVYDLEDYLEED
jgi:phage terminase large subunit-like protein